MINWCIRVVRSLFVASEPPEPIVWQLSWSQFLQKHVAFYRVLSEEHKELFHRRILLFWQTTIIESGRVEVEDDDRLLIASSAIIPVWAFPGWHYFNLKSVYLLPGAFNGMFECGEADSNTTGMVGSGPMEGKLVLSQPALHLGFNNSRDGHNVGIHEFVHLIDMTDGECDGFPERLKEYSFSIPWFELVEHKIAEICNNNSNIHGYGATNRQEFFAVASEYFFERPKMLQRKHPLLFSALSEFYQQDVMNIESDIKLRRKSPCPCGSGKRYKRCCLPDD